MRSSWKHCPGLSTWILTFFSSFLSVLACSDAGKAMLCWPLIPAKPAQFLLGQLMCVTGMCDNRGQQREKILPGEVWCVCSPSAEHSWRHGADPVNQVTLV